MPELTITITTLISVLSVAFAIFFGLKSKRRADNEEVAKKAESITRLEDKIDTLTKSFSDFTTEIKLEIRDMRKNFDEVKAKQIEQETIIKHIIQRIDKMEGA